LAVRIRGTAWTHTTRTNFNWILNNATRPAALIIPQDIRVPEIPKLLIFVIMVGVMPAIPVLMKLRLERKKRGIKGKGWREEFQEWWDKLTGRKEVALDELPV